MRMRRREAGYLIVTRCSGVGYSTTSKQIMKRTHVLNTTTGCVIACCLICVLYVSVRILPNGSEPPRDASATDKAISQKTSPAITQKTSPYNNTRTASTKFRIVSNTKQDASKNVDDQAYTTAAISNISVDANTSSSTMPTRVQNIEDNRYDSMEDGGSPMTATVDRKAACFLYLIQTESCLPPDQRKNESFGNGSLDFHVLVLSYKKTCDDHSLSHVEYVFDASTTWTTGRNLLFTLAMKRNITYLYYIFMDDDATAKDIRTNALAWRAFEGFLQSMEPAVMALDLPGQDYSEKVLQIHKNRGCFIKELEYVTGLWYDAMVNAFHYKAIKYLLPYISAFDQQTWWASQMALIVRTEILFRGQLLLHRYIRVTGYQHRPYPRNLNFPPNMYSWFTQGLDAHFVPGCVAKCAQIMIDRWMKFSNANGWSSSTLCLPPPPPHDPVEPCRYQCHLV